MDFRIPDSKHYNNLSFYFPIKKHNDLLLVENGNEIVGYAAFSTKPGEMYEIFNDIVDISDSLKIYDLGVMAKYQNQGIGSMILDKLEEIAKKEDISLIFADNHPHLTDFLKKKGFHRLEDGVFGVLMKDLDKPYVNGSYKEELDFEHSLFYN